MRKFRYAGVSRMDGKVVLRATNRELPTYPNLLEREGNTSINIVKLDKPMTKEQIREHLARRKDFRSPQILAVLKPKEGRATPKKRVAKKVATSRKRAPANKEPVSAAA